MKKQHDNADESIQEEPVTVQRLHGQRRRPHEAFGCAACMPKGLKNEPALDADETKASKSWIAPR